MSDLSKERGISQIEVTKELENRKRVLQQMAEKSITSHEKVASLIRRYYYDPEGVLEELS